MIIEAAQSEINSTLFVSDATTPTKDQWTVVFDVMFCIGGFTKEHVYLPDWVVKIGGSQTIFDGIWCWGADHGVLGCCGQRAVYDGVRPSRGIQVNGQNCIFYGLCIEHMNEGPFFEVNGPNCSVYGYMSELTYYLEKQYSEPIIRIGQYASNFYLTGWNFYTFSMGPKGGVTTPVVPCCVLVESDDARLPSDAPGKINVDPCSKQKVTCTQLPST
jgi:hypothetical protein